MTRMFNKFNNKKINENYIPDNRLVFISDINNDTIVKGQTCEYTFKIIGLRINYIKDVIMDFKMGIEPYLTKQMKDIEFKEFDEGLFISTTLTSEETENVVFNREMKAQLKIILKDDKVIISNIDNIKIIPNIINNMED